MFPWKENTLGRVNVNKKSVKVLNVVCLRLHSNNFQTLNSFKFVKLFCKLVHYHLNLLKSSISSMYTLNWNFRRIWNIFEHIYFTRCETSVKQGYHFEKTLKREDISQRYYAFCYYEKILTIYPTRDKDPWRIFETKIPLKTCRT